MQWLSIKVATSWKIRKKIGFHMKQDSFSCMTKFWKADPGTLPHLRWRSLEQLVTTERCKGLHLIGLQQGLIQAAFNIGIPILNKLIWACPNLSLRETEATIKCNSSFLSNQQHKGNIITRKYKINVMLVCLDSLKVHCKVWDNFWHLKALWKRWKMLFISP